MTTQGDDAQPLTAHELALLAELDGWADTLDELGNIFRATAGERSAGLAYVYADCAATLRRFLRAYRDRAGG